MCTPYIYSGVHIIILQSCCRRIAAAAAPAVDEITRTKNCAGAAGAFVVRHRLPDDAICCCGLLHLIPIIIFLY